MNASTRTPTVQSPGSAPLSRRHPASPLSGHPLARRLAPALLACALLAGPALAAAPGERPRPQDFPDYGSYVKALVDYQRALETPPKKEEKKIGVDDSKLCRDSQGGGEDDKKKNNCEGKYLVTENEIPEEVERQRVAAEAAKAEEARRQEEAAQHEDLEDTISRNSTSFIGGDLPGGLPGTTTPRGFPLEEISAADLSEAGVSGLLGLFENVRMGRLGSTAAPGGIFGGATGGSGAGGSGGSAIDPDGTLTATLENFLIDLSEIDYGFLASIISFGDGYSIVNAAVRINDSGNGLLLGLSSETYTPLYVVDRDGVPDTKWAGAGAVVVDRMAILIPYLEADIQSVRNTTTDTSLLRIDAYSPQPIFVDFSETTISAASATRDGSQIGASAPVIQFGTNSLLTIEAGTRIRAVMSPPDGTRTPLVTLNGRVGNISLGDVRLVDNIGGGSIGVGRFTLSGIELIDTKIYMDERKIIIDSGRGFHDVNVGVERLWIGSDPESSVIGDFYASGARLNSLRITAEPH